MSASIRLEGYADHEPSLEVLSELKDRLNIPDHQWNYVIEV